MHEQVNHSWLTQMLYKNGNTQLRTVFVPLNNDLILLHIQISGIKEYQIYHCLTLFTAFFCVIHLNLTEHEQVQITGK